MNSTEENALAQTDAALNLTAWPKLSKDEQAFVVAYVENGYSVSGAVGDTGLGRSFCDRALRSSNVRQAIAEVQSELGSIDFLNEKWVKAQLLRIFPMAMGDEPVPIVTQAGEEMMARKFYPDIAMRVVEYVAPKTQKQPGFTLTINNVSRMSDAQLERIAGQGRTFEHGE